MHARAALSLLILLAGTMFGASAIAQNEPPPPPVPAPPVESLPPPPPAFPPPAAEPPPPMMMPPPPVDVALPPPEVPKPVAAVPVKIDSPTTTIKFGLLMQPQYEALGDFARDSYAQNIFLRRTRFLIGGSLFGVIDYFVETDFFNLFKAVNVPGAGGAPNMSVKATPGMNIQDAFVTYKPMGDLLKIDVGYMLPPMAHNAIQGATTLYGWDYFAYTFQHTNAFGTSANPVGRDVGVELRGLVLGGHLEYRVGLFQGLRNAQTATEQGSRNFFRVMARAQINFLDAEPGFFYAGTYFGTKRILSIGGSYEFQDDPNFSYAYIAGDGFLDLPLGPGVVTAQVNVAHWNGGTFVPLAKQTAYIGEAGYNFSAVQLGPIVRVEHLTGTGEVPPAPNQTRIAGGLAFWHHGHNSNLKAFYSRNMQDGTPHGANQFILQAQVYFF